VSGTLPPEAFGQWVHSGEEDTADAKVYRPEGYPLPRSRGRAGFEIREDGTFVSHRIAATDGIAHATGRWRPEGPGRIRATFPSGAAPPVVLHLVESAADRLVVRFE
jgi:hypothetical protein